MCEREREKAIESERKGKKNGRQPHRKKVIEGKGQTMTYPRKKGDIQTKYV